MALSVAVAVAVLLTAGRAALAEGVGTEALHPARVGQVVLAVAVAGRMAPAARVGWAALAVAAVAAAIHRQMLAVKESSFCTGLRGTNHEKSMAKPHWHHTRRVRIRP